MPVVVTVTKPGVTVTVTPTSSAAASSTLSAGTVAGIIIGTLLGGVLFIVLVLYLLNRYNRHKFTRVVNPAHDRVSAAGGAPDLRDLPSTSSGRAKFFARHSQKHSISTEPLIFPVSWPPLPSTSRVQSPGTPRSDSISPGIRDSQNSPYDLGEINQVVATGTVSHSALPAILNIPPARKPDETSLRSGSGNTPPQPRQTSGDDTSSSPKLQPTLFIHRMLQSRAQASEGASLAYPPSLDFSSSRSTTQDSSSLRADEERLLAEAEHTALRDAEGAQREEERIMPDKEDDWAEAESTESIYSQISAPIDHSAFFSDPVSRQNSSSSLPRRKSSRKQPRTSVPPTELPPVAEVPDTPRALAGRSDSRISAAGNSTLDGQASHGTASRPMSSAIDQPGTLPLLTSANFGKNSTASGTPPGSVSSTVGWGSSSSGRASRYPSLATSSIGQSSRSGPRSDAGTDWRHPPSGLAGLASLQIGPLHNPHSPVEEQPEEPDVPPAPGLVPTKRAHLREGTVRSMPEVERRTVMQGGIAHIDVAL